MIGKRGYFLLGLALAAGAALAIDQALDVFDEPVPTIDPDVAQLVEQNHFRRGEQVRELEHQVEDLQGVAADLRQRYQDQVQIRTRVEGEARRRVAAVRREASAGHAARERIDQVGGEDLAACESDVLELRRALQDAAEGADVDCLVTGLELGAKCRAETADLEDGSKVARLFVWSDVSFFVNDVPWGAESDWMPADEVRFQFTAPPMGPAWRRSWWAGVATGLDALGPDPVVGVSLQRRKWGILGFAELDLDGSPSAVWADQSESFGLRRGTDLRFGVMVGRSW